MSEPGVEILYESGPCLVVCKPPGVLTQAPPGIDSLEVRIKALLAGRRGKQGDVYLGVPHRLDRPASGVMVFGKRAGATRRLAEQFERREVTKVYWAFVQGEVAPAQGTWRDQVRKIPGEARAEVVGADHREGRRAVLRYQTLGVAAAGCLLQIELETGRTHQVRVQAGRRGHPILGDTLYGSTMGFGTQFEDPRLRAIALHARSLTFAHPTTQDTVCVVAPAWRDWHALGLPLE